MGEHTSKAGGGGGGALRAGQNSTTEIAGRNLTRINAAQAKQDFISSNDPSSFLSHNAPDDIDINGIDFRRFSTLEMTDSDGVRHHISTYQSMTQASNGEYPLFTVDVKTGLRRKKRYYEFDTSTFGTGMR